MRLAIDSVIEIGRDVVMPRLGLGTYKSAAGDEVERAVESALAHGYRAIDTASLYGNEEGVGSAVRASGVPREDLFLTSKVWNDEQGFEGTLAAIAGSLERLGTDYLDLYLVHWPIREHIEDTWRGMEEALERGLTRAIGVSNFLPHHLDELLAIADVPPAVDQVEFHPWLQQPGLQAYLAEHDIALEAWAPLMKGNVTEEPVLVEIGARHGKTPAQVAIRWVLQNGFIVIPKSVHDERIAANADVFDFELSDADMNRIFSLDRGHRFGPDPDAYAW